jgi:hypothetical protein
MFFVGLFARLNAFFPRQWDYFIGEMERQRLLKKSDENIADCRRKLELIEADQGASTEHKAELRASLEAMEKSHFQLRLKGSVTVTEKA